MSDRLSKVSAPRRVRIAYIFLNLVVILALSTFALRGVLASWKHLI